MRIVCLSDTHSKHNEITVPDGDLLLIAGDVTHRGKRPEVEAFSAWVAQLPHPHKVLIGGNHDFLLETEPPCIPTVTYLLDELGEVAGLRIYGSPFGPWRGKWAFPYQRGAEARAHWQKLPDQVDILLTHTPPYGILDKSSSGVSLGCEMLLERLKVVQPKVHIFGHIHASYGRQRNGGTEFINASNYNSRRGLVNAPVVFGI